MNVSARQESIPVLQPELRGICNTSDSTREEESMSPNWAKKKGHSSQTQNSAADSRMQRDQGTKDIRN